MIKVETTIKYYPLITKDVVDKSSYLEFNSADDLLALLKKLKIDYILKPYLELIKIFASQSLENIPFYDKEITQLAGLSKLKPINSVTRKDCAEIIYFLDIINKSIVDGRKLSPKK